MKRAIIIVLDAVGIGELPDADKYGDKGSNTLMHVKEALPSLNLKNMCDLGLGLIDLKDFSIFLMPIHNLLIHFPGRLHINYKFLYLQLKYLLQHLYVLI